MIVFAATLLTLALQILSIQGIVVRQGSSDPLSNATVELRGDSENTLIRSITTEADGRFLFENIRPGRYHLTATRRGYVRPPLTVTIAAGQPAPYVQLPMTLTGAISGRVYDTNGQPIGNIEVQAFKASYPEGRRVLIPVRSVVTNDLGDYRLFWLAPGRYYVAAIHPRAQGMFRRMFGGIRFGMRIGTPDVFTVASGQADPALGGFEPEPESESDYYAPIYFGGTVDQELASAIDLRPASDFGGANIVVGPVRARHVRGVVLDGTTGQRAQYASIMFSRDMDRPVVKDPEVDRENATFDILLLPGVHTLNASSASGSGYAIVKVGDTDINNVTIMTTPGFDIRGRIAIEGQPGTVAFFDSLRIRLRPDTSREEDPGNSAYSVPLADGSFTVDAGTGDYRVNIAPILNITPLRGAATLPPAFQNAYVKSIRLGNADVLNGGLHLERLPTAPLEVVIGTNPGALDGQVVSERQGPVSDLSVVLVPQIRRRIELYRTTTTDSNGRFHFDRLPPGDYKVFSWEEVEDGAWYDPEFLRPYENQGALVRIVEGRTENARVPVR
jgi:protocatechuate 3,4-dioxygenase beta subunit